MAVNILRDVLSQNLIDRIFAWNEETKGGDVWASNQVKWLDVLKYSTTGTILSRVLPENLRADIYNEIYSRGKINWMPQTTSALFYMGFPLSCVNWHPDFPEYDAMSIYLSREWDSNWGGWFAWTTENAGKDLSQPSFNVPYGYFWAPQFNTAIHSTNTEWHSTTPIAANAPVRYSIQLWFSKKSTA
jgi:hypothetical protein